MESFVSKQQVSQRFVVRMGGELHATLGDAALHNHRSLNSEIVHRLESTLASHPSFAGEQAELGLTNEEFTMLRSFRSLSPMAKHAWTTIMTELQSK